MSEHELPRLGITICVEPPSDNKDPEPVSGGSIDWTIHSPYEDPNNNPNAIWEARSPASSDSGWSNPSNPLQEYFSNEDRSDFLLDNRSYVSGLHYREEFDIEAFLNLGSDAVQSPDTDYFSSPYPYISDPPMMNHGGRSHSRGPGAHRSTISEDSSAFMAAEHNPEASLFLGDDLRERGLARAKFSLSSKANFRGKSPYDRPASQTEITRLEIPVGHSVSPNAHQEKRKKFSQALEEPHFMTSLDHALTNFQTDISPWTCPRDWLDADINHVISAIQVFVASTQSAEIEEANFGGYMVYQRLIIYILAHLMFCTNNQRLLNDFKRTLAQWRNWDFITQLSQQQLIKNHLLYNFRHALHSHSETVIGQLLSLDITRLCAQLTVMVTDDTQYKQLLDLRGPTAQALLNLLQARLDVAFDPALKRRHVKALIRLSRVTGLYPECLILKGIDILGDAVAGGSFADIFKGRLGDQMIAVKMLKVFERSDIDKLLREFSSEAVTWRQLCHPNVTPFYGVYRLARNPPRLCFVCPWMENGNLKHFLANRAPNTDCVSLSLDIALGLEYLHSEGIIHGDLKALNVLVSPSRRACLSDFGLSTARDSKPTVRSYMSTERSTGTLRWQAPELFPNMLNPDAANPNLRTTFATDVYAFAMVCYEMFSGTYPFNDVANDYMVIIAIQRGKRPLPPTHDLSWVRGLSDEILRLIDACWTQEASARPSAGEIVEKLRALPDRPVDLRPIDTFNSSFSSQVLQNHPFSVLVTST